MIITSRACVLARQDNAAQRACSPVQPATAVSSTAETRIKTSATRCYPSRRGRGLESGLCSAVSLSIFVFQSADRDLQVLGLLFLGCDSLD
jgi:hypothetical protein